MFYIKQTSNGVKKMLTDDDIKKIETLIGEFFQKMTIDAKVEVKINAPGYLISPADRENTEGKNEEHPKLDVVELNIKIDDPQILIGERGQTLNEIQRILKNFLNKKLGKLFYLNLDINDYKKKKIEYLKGLAHDLADEVVLTKKEKSFLPMSAYERRIVHIELANRPDIATESEGEEPCRKVIIKPK